MNPVLLDQTSLFKFGIAVILVMTGAFLSGYYVGCQQADRKAGLELNKMMLRASPGLARADLAALASFRSRSQPFDFAADVDTRDLDPDRHAGQQSVAAESQAKNESAAAITATNQPEPAPEQGDSAAQPPPESGQQQLASLATPVDLNVAASSTHAIEPAAVRSQPQPDAGQQLTETIASSRQAGIIDASTAEDARYTIQVGVFADPDNAKRRKAQLDALQLTAYVNEYKNQRDQPRFNVRFGYFKDKASARAALTRFENDMSGSAYVTTIRRN